VTPTPIAIPETPTRLAAFIGINTYECANDPARLYQSHAVRDPSLLATTHRAHAPRFRRDIEKPAKVLDAELADGRAFVAGQHVTIADCTLFAAMEFARTGNLGIAWPAHLARGYERFRARPSASAWRQHCPTLCIPLEQPDKPSNPIAALHSSRHRRSPHSSRSSCSESPISRRCRGWPSGLPREPGRRVAQLL